MKGLLKHTFMRVIEPFIVNTFHYLWYNSSETWSRNTFLGYRIEQCPLDLQLYHELVYKLRPDFVLQTGVAGGGSLLFFATLLDLIGAPLNNKVFGIDIKLTEEAKSLSHSRIRLFEGDSADPDLIKKIKKEIIGENGLIILDSDHRKQHVVKELKAYKDFVGKDNYLVVEDTNINGHPVFGAFGPGPMEAVNDFLKENSEFIRDDEIWKRNKFSFHQRGWLKRVK